MSPMAVLLKNGLLAICILIGLTKSSPVEPATAVDQAPESHAPVEYPPALLARYYDRNPEILSQPDLVDEGEVVRKRSDSSRGRYWNLLNALEEELALEALSRQGPELEEPITNEVEPVNDAHKVNKRRRRYGFWVTAINKMDGGNLRGFLGKHKNIYNVYKRGSSFGRWLPRPLMSPERYGVASITQ